MKEPLDILKHYWGYESFRPMQEEIIQSVLDGQDTLALLPTGGGKSVCFQVPALCMEGICVVVSPLIALMKDQVEQLRKRDIKASAIFSGMSKREIDITLDNCIYGDIKFLYVSPERLKTELFLERAKQMKVSLLAVDEAHCISQWGYDFRPPYLEIAQFKNEMGIQRLIALTASATKEVKEDIQEKLEMQSPAIFQQSFARSNLSYSAFNLEAKEQKLLEVLHNVQGSSIIYVRTRKRTKDLDQFLKRKGISADFYHGGLSGKDRSERQDAWIGNQTRVMVATNAFGMGIDKPDVRTVIHMDLPDTLEAYYQEAGRAGRDGKKAFAVILFHAQDISELKERVSQSVVTLDELKRTYQALANYYKMAIGSVSYRSFEFEFDQFIKTYQLSPTSTYAAIKKLNGEGLIQLTEGFYEKSKLIFSLERPDVYKYQVANPKLDKLIKALLRLYGGEAFSSYIFISEPDVSRLMKIKPSELRQQLRYLHDQEVIDYHESTDVPKLTFLTPRQHPDQLSIDKNLLKQRRKLAIAKAKSVVDYVLSNDCRTNILQRYFDEEPNGKCGICDNDLDKKKSAEPPSLKELKAVLNDSFKNLVDITAALSIYKEPQIMQVLRVLVEDGKVEEKDGRFRLI